MASQHILPSRWGKKAREKYSIARSHIFFRPFMGGRQSACEECGHFSTQAKMESPGKQKCVRVSYSPPFPPRESQEPRSGPQFPPFGDRFSFQSLGLGEKRVPKKNGTLAHLGSTQVGEKKEETRKFYSFSTCCFGANQNKHGRTFSPENWATFKGHFFERTKKLPYTTSQRT